MATYSNHAQRELDAESFAEDDRRRAAHERVVCAPEGAVAASPRLPAVTVPDETELDDDIHDAISDALADGDGCPVAFYLRHHLAQRGLVIVESTQWGSAKIALQLIGSTAVAAANRMES
jgi:hypothetical protein